MRERIFFGSSSLGNSNSNLATKALSTWYVGRQVKANRAIVDRIHRRLHPRDKTMTSGRYLLGAFFASILISASCFVPQRQWGVPSQQPRYLFDKMFEEEGPLGKGITVGKVQVALLSPDRGEGSIFSMLEDNARWVADDDEPGSLADLAHEVCLSLLRKKDSWTAACSDFRWFSAKEFGKAESQFNDWANAEAAKFEKVGIEEKIVIDTCRRTRFM
jgi:Protein of unknown function (DUF1517)